MNIQPIVEGHGEVSAVPVLLRRLIGEAQRWEVGVGNPIRRKRSEFATEQGVAGAVTLARVYDRFLVSERRTGSAGVSPAWTYGRFFRRRTRLSPAEPRRASWRKSNAIAKELSYTPLAREKRHCGGILLLFDSDDDCPAELGPRVQGWATTASAATPCAVCMAHREYEAWFLATADSLREHESMRADAMAHPTPESPRSAKGALKRCMTPNDHYKETTHQAAFSAKMSLAAAFQRSRSFKKLVTSFGALMASMGQPPPAWPPPHWVEGG